MSFRWGKFRGIPLVLVPASYLGWALEEATSLAPELRADILVELVERFDIQPPASNAPVVLPDDATAGATDELVRLGYCALAGRVHPDRGGSHQAMVAATMARDWLARSLAIGVSA